MNDRPQLLRRLDALASWALDAAIAAATFVPTVLVLGFDQGPPGQHSMRVVEIIAASVLSVLPLLVRRRWPVAVLAFILAVAVAIPGPAIFSPPALLAVYTVASRRERDLAVGGALATLLAFVAHRLLWGYDLPAIAVLTMAALSAFALAAGLYQRTRLAYLEQLAERARRLERERTLLAEQAVTDERLRIARELHDVVGGNVSLMVIAAQGLGAATTDPGARRASDSIAELGRETMREMHATLELLRPGDADPELDPPPTLGDLDALVGQSRAAGLPVELRIDGRPRSLPVAVELSAYRIVQEALTNVIRHAGAASASVRLRYDEEGLELLVADDGRGCEAGGELIGHGLVGMRERVALFGGRFDAGPRGDGGFQVSATLPCGAGEDR